MIFWLSPYHSDFLDIIKQSSKELIFLTTQRNYWTLQLFDWQGNQELTWFCIFWRRFNVTKRRSWRLSFPSWISIRFQFPFVTFKLHADTTAPNDFWDPALVEMKRNLKRGLTAVWAAQVGLGGVYGFSKNEI